MTSVWNLLISTLLCLQFFILVTKSQSPMDAGDVYTFCGQGKSKGDNSACLGFCSSGETSCSSETGVCSCKSPVKRLPNLSSNYDCKPARGRTRCHNACKTYVMLTPRFRRGEVKVCQSKTENKKMCFCLPK